MSSENLKKSIIALSPYIPAYGRHALIERLLSVSEPGSGARSFDKGLADYKDEAMALYELVEGGKYYEEILERIANSVPNNQTDEQLKQLSGFVRFTLDSKKQVDVLLLTEKSQKFLNKKYLGIGGSKTGIEDPIGGIERNRNKNVGLVAVEMLDPDLGLSTRDASSVSIFTSLIPPVEMSRCVPYLNVKLSVDAPIFSSEDGKPILDRPSILTYLYGNGTAIDKASLSNLGYSLHFAESRDKFSAQTASMEIFTSPQTMAPPPDSPALVGEGIGRENVPRVLDRFRPLMSLKSLSLSVVPTRGFMSYKSGKMEIVLHDRSRLAEVSAFVRPGVYQGTELDIEYGWSHPEGNSDRNVFGAFLNGMRTREKYSVVNSSFSFDEVGQVNISLVIAMKGTKTLETIDISGLPSGAQKIDEILKNVATAFNSLNKNGASYAKNIFGETILDASSTTDATLSLDDTKLAEIRKKLRALSNKNKVNENPDIRGIIDDLQKIYGENGAVADAKTSANQAVQEKLANLTGTPGYDDVFPWYENGKISDKPELATIADGTVSFGRIILSLVAQPIAKTNQFEEVQVIFHPMNSKASYMRNLSIAKFPIKRDEFETKMTEYLTKNPRMNPVQLFNLVSSDFLSDPSSYPYGLRELFEQKDGKFVRKESTNANDAAAKLKQENEVLERAGITNGVLNFVKPELYSECVPYAGDPSKTILRIHIVDAACKSYDTLYQFLKSVNLDDINSFGIEDRGVSTLWSSESAEAPEIAYLQSKKANLMQKIKRRILPTAQSQARITPSKDSVGVEVRGGSAIQGNTLSQTKKFISQGVPTIRYGQQGSAINSIGITSMNDPKLTTTNIINMTKNESTRPDNTDRSRGLPIFISPTQCTIEMHGCPSLQHMQFFFVDLQTGTTADNMYAVNGLEHKIEPGRFTTSTTLHLVDSYGAYRNPISKIQTTTAFLSTLLENQENVIIDGVTTVLTPSVTGSIALLGINAESLAGRITNLIGGKNNFIVLDSNAKYSGIFYSEIDSSGISPTELSKYTKATQDKPYFVITIPNLEDEKPALSGFRLADVDRFYVLKNKASTVGDPDSNKKFAEAFLGNSKDKAESFLEDDRIRIDLTSWYDTLPAPPAT